MAFSLNPGSSAPEAGGQGIAPPADASAPTLDGSAAPTLPDSPFLFIQYRNQEKPITAYVQIVLMTIAAMSVVICVVLYGYSVYLKHSIESKQQELLAMDATFKDYPFEEMRRLSQRAAYLKDFMTSYVSVLSPLLFLEKVVEKQVVFNDFSLAKGEGGYTITFTAITNNYRALIQQLDALNLTEYNKIVPTPKQSGLSDSDNIVKVRVNSPVFVQGKLPGEIESFFEIDSTKTSSSTQSTTVVSTTTQQ